MGNELFNQNNEHITENNNNENDDLFKDLSNKNQLVLKYKINYPGEKIRLVGSKFYENNKANCQICIDFVVKELNEFYIAKKNENFIKVTLAISHKIKDLSYMFCECSSLISISNLNDLNINNVTNLSNIFFGCSSLTSLSDISRWQTNKVIDMSHMFHGCSSLKSLPLISKWETNNVIDMSYMFYGCSSLTSLDDISIWNISKVNNISLLFYECPLLNNKEKILTVFFNKNPLLKIKEEEEIKRIEEEKRRIEEERKRKEEEERRRIEEERRRIEEERRRKEEEERRRIEEERRRIEAERKRKEEEKRRIEEESKRREEEERRRQKEEIIKKQMEFRKKKISDENVKVVLEDMCILGSIMKKEIIKEKKIKPEKFISIQEATKEENKKKNEQIFCLGILAQALENIGITTAIERNESKNKELENVSNTALQFLMNGMIEKEKYDFHFDFGEKRNDELLYNLDEQKKFNNKLRKKLSKEYNIPEDEIIITNPQKGSYIVQVIFESKDFNDRSIDINKFKKNCTEKEFEELKNLKDIQTSLIMEGCKLSERMLDPRGNRESGFEVGGKRGGFDYCPPEGWKGFGLKVWDNYDNGNNDWLGCNGNPNEWAVAYHGIGSKGGSKVQDAARKIFIGQQFKYDASGISGQACKGHANINKRNNAFIKEVGIGAYCSPDPKVMEQYAEKTIINGKFYQLGFMMRVKPDKIRISKVKQNYWVLDGTTKEMRPYRLMIKEC